MSTYKVYKTPAQRQIDAIAALRKMAVKLNMLATSIETTSRSFTEMAATMDRVANEVDLEGNRLLDVASDMRSV